MNTVRRSRGRLKKDAADLKPAILGAATQEFSSKGFDGARVDAIARAAGVNINLIYHYFGNKESLFVAVMEAAYRLIRTHHNDMNLRALDPEAAMGDLVRSTFELFSENPHIIGLLSSENLHEACHVRNSAEIEKLYNPLLDFIRETLARGVANGTFREGVDPVELFITINAQSYFHLSNQHTLGFILHRDLTSPESLAFRKAHVVDVVLSYLTCRTGKK
jgi:TetR/AcrR family transcriptional regulator